MKLLGYLFQKLYVSFLVYLNNIEADILPSILM